MRFSTCIDAGALRTAIAAQCGHADRAIRADGERRAATLAADAADGAVRAGAASRCPPSAAFLRTLRLTVDTLELTLYGHCAYRTFGWERRREAVFSLQRAPWWRRLLGTAPLMALTFDARGGPPVPGPAAAARRRPRRPTDTVIRLDPACQAALAEAHAVRIAGRFTGHRLPGMLLRRWRRDGAS